MARTIDVKGPNPAHRQSQVEQDEDGRGNENENREYFGAHYLEGWVHVRGRHFRMLAHGNHLRWYTAFMPPTPAAPKPEQEPVDIFEVIDRTPERPPEVKPEKVREALEQHGSRFEQHPEVSVQVKETPSIAPAPAMPLPISAPDQQLQQVEQVLAEGLQDIFASLPPAEQQKFKVSGEQAAQEVDSLLRQVKVKVSAIVDVIRRWLSSIPGVNKFFVEQEAKIKAEKLVKLVLKA